MLPVRRHVRRAVKRPASVTDTCELECEIGVIRQRQRAPKMRQALVVGFHSGPVVQNVPMNLCNNTKIRIVNHLAGRID